MGTNYTSIGTCVATGENAIIKLRSQGYETTSPEAREYLGPDASWDQCRAFEWGYLAYEFQRQGDAERAAYCEGRIAALKAGR